MKLADLLKKLASKGKLDLTKAEIVALLESVKDTEVPQEFADQLEAALMTSEAAVANPDIRKRIQAEFLNGEDAYLNSLLPDLDIDEATRTSLTSDKDTRSKIRKTIAILVEDKKKAAKKGDSKTEDAKAAEIAALQERLRESGTTSAARIKDLESQLEQKDITNELNALLGVKQYNLPDSMNAKTKVRVALMQINEDMAQKGLKVILKDGSVQLVKAETGVSAIDDKNNIITLSSFIDGALATNGLLKNSDSSQGQQQQQSPLPGSGSEKGLPVVEAGFFNNLQSQIDSLKIS